MCKPFESPRYRISAKAVRYCDLGERHVVEELNAGFKSAHDLYRAAKEFYEKHGQCTIEMHIVILPEPKDESCTPTADVRDGQKVEA